ARSGRRRGGPRRRRPPVLERARRAPARLARAPHVAHRTRGGSGMSALDFADGVLFFPVTAIGESGCVDLGAPAAHGAEPVAAGPGGVFAACGTGEFHAMSATEHAGVVRAAVEATAGRVPVLAGAGGPLAHAIGCVRAAQDAGADGILLLPPYLVEGPADGV